jgi:hypothetical protein
MIIPSDGIDVCSCHGHFYAGDLFILQTISIASLEAMTLGNTWVRPSQRHLGKGFTDLTTGTSSHRARDRLFHALSTEQRLGILHAERTRQRKLAMDTCIFQI